MHFRETKVSIVKCPDVHEFGAVKTTLTNLTGLIGGLESLVTPGDQVLIKPNLLCGASYKTGITTNPNVIFGIADLCYEVGAKQVIIAEGSAIGEDTDRVFDRLKMREPAEKHHCRLVNLVNDEFTYGMNPLGRIFKRVRLPQTFIESNVIINVPVMKTHDVLGVTLGLKNMKGIIHSSDKKRFHKWGLAQAVVDLGHLAMPELTIMDGTIALEGMGPVIGHPMDLGLLLASTDTIAVDRVCLEIMGFGLDEVEYLRMAGEQGLGCNDLDQITIVGEELNAVRRPFERLSLDQAVLEQMNIRIVASGACSGCNNAINSYLYRLQLEGKLEKLKDCTIVYGPNFSVPNKYSDKVILHGVCTRDIKFDRGIYIPGCPPHPLHIEDFLDGKGLEKE